MPRTKCNDLPNRSILHMEALAVRRMKWPVCWVAGQNGREGSCHDITNLSPGSAARKARTGWSSLHASLGFICLAAWGAFAHEELESADTE